MTTIPSGAPGAPAYPHAVDLDALQPRFDVLIDALASQPFSANALSGALAGGVSEAAAMLRAIPIQEGRLLERGIGIIAGLNPELVVLSQTLRRLQRDGLVRRTVYPVVPPHTEYSLTDLGESLMTPLSILCSWGAQHLPQIDAARRSAAEPAPRVLETVP